MQRHAVSIATGTSVNHNIKNNLVTVGEVENILKPS